MPLDSLRLDKVRDQTIGWLTDMLDDAGLQLDIEVDQESNAASGQIENKDKKMIFELHSSALVESETVYKIFLRILLTESDKGAIICQSEPSDEVLNLARLYGISVVPMRTRSLMENSLKKTLREVFG